MKKNYKGIEINTSKNTHETVFTFVSKNDPKASVLDIPCGRGALAQRLEDNHYKVTSSDIVSNLFQLDPSRFVHSDLNKTLPFSDDSFDVVTCVDGIAHVENIPHTIREFNRIIKANGSLIISTPNISSLRSRFRYFLTGFHNKRKLPLNESTPTPEHLINIIELPMLRYFLHTNNFKIIGLKTNRTKPISWGYGILVPFFYLFSRFVFKREKQDPSERRANLTILNTLFTVPILFGETMVIHAKNTK
ncbi:hypothetical protein DSLASN_46020 [Desulfoluna limicola]|uniref:Methyltransferase type 11 domain-containing protein n=1 Tax=Desulfoluna limicola TaxID=2810562 RepID=A0ABM7PP19_9BACT|nr:class I SAM-dependent methyltransferase [Desulfoluna limicola]BCS98970.1 hypothetical protein DSLASN_46020 [Desulfoluna limicola]